MAEIIRLPVGPLQANCYLLGCPETSLAAVIDPGGDPKVIRGALEKRHLTPYCIINTHAHPDHTAANAEIQRLYGIPLWIHEDDAPMLSHAEELGALTGLAVEPSPPPARLLRGGEEIRLGSLTLTVIHTPGHSPGSICLFLPGGEGTPPLLFTGDTVFAGSAGRTDLPGGSYRDLMDSLRGRIATLPSSTRLLPGHGPETTLERERRSNPFFAFRSPQHGWDYEKM